MELPLLMSMGNLWIGKNAMFLFCRFCILFGRLVGGVSKRGKRKTQKGTVQTNRDPRPKIRLVRRF